MRPRTFTVRFARSCTTPNPSSVLCPTVPLVQPDASTSLALKTASVTTTRRLQRSGVEPATMCSSTYIVLGEDQGPHVPQLVRPHSPTPHRPKRKSRLASVYSVYTRNRLPRLAYLRRRHVMHPCDHAVEDEFCRNTVFLEMALGRCRATLTTHGSVPFFSSGTPTVLTSTRGR